jgi:hypothetical protein
VTNDQYTAEKCGNRVILDERELLEQLRQYVASIIGDREVFISRVLGELDRLRPQDREPEQCRQALEAERKKLSGKRERYQELYANDLITMDELKQKLGTVTERLRSIDEELAQLRHPEQPGGDREQSICRQEIMKFLKLETVTNMDLRRILDHISVNQDGTIRVVLKKLDEIEGD